MRWFAEVLVVGSIEAGKEQEGGRKGKDLFRPPVAVFKF